MPECALLAKYFWFASGGALGSAMAFATGWPALVLVIEALGLGLYAQSLSSEAADKIWKVIDNAHRSSK
jgi:hypothetical protein